MGFFHILRFSEKGFVLFQACSLNLTYIPDDIWKNSLLYKYIVYAI